MRPCAVYAGETDVFGRNAPLCIRAYLNIAECNIRIRFFCTAPFSRAVLIRKCIREPSIFRENKKSADFAKENQKTTDK